MRTTAPGHVVARGRFCLICHQRPGDPQRLSCPLSNALLHLLPYSSGSPPPGSAAQACIQNKGGPIVPSLSPEPGSDYTDRRKNPTKCCVRRKRAGFWVVIKQTQIMVFQPCRIQGSDAQSSTSLQNLLIHADYRVVLSNPET